LGIGFLLLLYVTAEAGSFFVRIDYVYFGMSFFTLLLYAKDKRAAIKGKWRIPEKMLHLCALFCGWPGAWIGQRWFHHKISKRSFMWKYYALLFLNIVLLALMVPYTWEVLFK
jgi:uncharacterized membrane protein YsdA (DUF1294 family)